MAGQGKLTVYYGCMFSGKTTFLIKHISDMKIKSNEFIVLKPSIDVRSGQATIKTHDGKSHQCIVYEPDADISEHINQYTKLIMIDEAQFFNKVFLSEIRRWLGKGIDIVAGGLDKDYLRRPFGLMPSLIELADEKHQLKATCQICNNAAEYTFRKADNKVLILIGQDNYYEARCLDCHLKGHL